MMKIFWSFDLWVIWTAYMFENDFGFSGIVNVIRKQVKITVNKIKKHFSRLEFSFKGKFNMFYHGTKGSLYHIV